MRTYNTPIIQVSILVIMEINDLAYVVNHVHESCHNVSILVIMEINDLASPHRLAVQEHQKFQSLL